MLSLVLVLASTIGSYAHTAHGAHQHDHGVHALVGDAPTTVVADDGHANVAPNTGAEHTSCGDLLCHGGFAILTGQVERHHLYQRSGAVIPRSDTRSGSGPSSLDRPPRHSVLV